MSRVETSRMPSIPPNASAESAACPPCPAMWTVDARVVGDLAQLVGGVGHLVPPVLAEVERDQRLRGLAVLGRDRADHLAGDAVDVGELLRVCLGRGEVVGAEAVGALVDDRGRDGVLALECLQLGERLGGLGVAGQPGGGLVVLHVDELGAEHARADPDDQPHGEHEPLDDGAGQLAGDLTMHGKTPSEKGRTAPRVFPRDVPEERVHSDRGHRQDSSLVADTWLPRETLDHLGARDPAQVGSREQQLRPPDAAADQGHARCRRSGRRPAAASPPAARSG